MSKIKEYINEQMESGVDVLTNNTEVEFDEFTSNLIEQ